MQKVWVQSRNRHSLRNKIRNVKIFLQACRHEWIFPNFKICSDVHLGLQTLPWTNANRFFVIKSTTFITSSRNTFSCLIGGPSKQKQNAVLPDPLVPLIMPLNVILNLFMTHSKKQGQCTIPLYTRTWPNRSLQKACDFKDILYTLLFGFRVYRNGVLHLDDLEAVTPFYPLRLIFVSVRAVMTSLISLKVSCSRCT